MTSYRQRFYRFQSEARGLLDPPLLQEAFDRWALAYRAFLLPYLPSDRSAAILDCACGYGNFLYFLRAMKYSNALGVDSDPSQVRLALSLGLPAEIADAMSFLKNRSSAFDVITALDFIEHLDKDQSLRFLDLVHAALKNEGHIILRTPCCDTLMGSAHRYNDITHEWGMTSVVAMSLLRMCGFVPVAIIDERPRIRSHNPLSLIRVIGFHAARLLVSAVLFCLGNPVPVVWTPSMWIVGMKRQAATSSRP